MCNALGIKNTLSKNIIPIALCTDVINSNNVIEDASWKSQSIIPKTMEIQNLTICKNENLEIRKLARYIFPKNDLGPTLAGQINFTHAQCLEFGVNLCMHRLPKDLKDIWD